VLIPYLLSNLGMGGGQGVRNPIVVGGYGKPQRLILGGFGPLPVHTGDAAVVVNHRIDAVGEFAAPVYTGSASLSTPGRVLSGDGNYLLEYVGDGSTVVVHAVQGEGTFEAPIYTGSGSFGVRHGFNGQGFTGTPSFSGDGLLARPNSLLQGVGTFSPPVYTGSGAVSVPHRLFAGSGTFVVDGGHAALVVSHILAGLGTFTPPEITTLREAIHHRLSTSSSVAGVVGDRITPYGRPQGQANPSITYQIVGRDFDRDLSGPNGLSTATVRISCWSKKYIEAEALAKAVRQTFDGYSGLIGGVSIVGFFCTDEGDLPEYPRNGTDSYLHQIVLTFNAIHRT